MGVGCLAMIVSVKAQRQQIECLLGSLDVPDRKLGSMVNGSMGYFTYLEMGYIGGITKFTNH